MFGTPPVVAPQPIAVSIHQEIINIPSADENEGVVVYKQPNEIIDVDSDSENSSSITPAKSFAPPPAG